MDAVKTAIGWLELPHWLIAAGALLVIAGLIGLAMNRRQTEMAQNHPASAPSAKPRQQLPPLPDLLDSRPRRDQRSAPTDGNPPLTSNDPK